MWKKITKLRERIQKETNFRKRTCWKCGKDLNIYDFLSDNTEFSVDYIIKLWQHTLLEFHCCECFKDLKWGELRSVADQLKYRYCQYCNKVMDLFTFSKVNKDLKIEELKKIWLNSESPIFCDNLCHRKFRREEYFKRLGQ